MKKTEATEAGAGKLPRGASRDVMAVLGRLRRLRGVLEASPQGASWEELAREIYGAPPGRERTAETERLQRSARRTFERDLALLATLAEEDEENPLGARVVYDRHVRRYGLEDRGRSLSVCLRLLGDDVRALRAGLLLTEHFLPQWRENAGGVWRQLAKLVRPEQAETGERLARAVAVAVPVSAEGTRGFSWMTNAFPRIVRALEEGRVLLCRCRSPYVGTEKTLTLHVSPWGLYFKHHAWYLWGKAVEYGTPGAFRLSRMQTVEILETPAESPPFEETLEDFAARDYDPNEPIGCRYAVRLRIHQPFATMAAETCWYPDQRISGPDPSRKDGTILFEATVTSLEGLSRWILSAAGCVEVLEPASLRRKLLEKTRRFVEANEAIDVRGEAEGGVEEAPCPPGALPEPERPCASAAPRETPPGGAENGAAGEEISGSGAPGDDVSGACAAAPPGEDDAFRDETRVLNLTQHGATEEQCLCGVREPRGKEEVRRLLTFGTLPSSGDVRRRAAALAELAAAERIRRVMIGGAPFLMGPLEAALRERDLVPVYAFSERCSTDEVQPDGSVHRVQVFRHGGFVEAVPTAESSRHPTMTPPRPRR